MTGIFKSTNPASVIILLLYAVFLKFPLFLHPFKPILTPNDSTGYKFLLGLFNPIYTTFPYIYSVLVFIMLFTQAIFFNKLVNAQHLYKQTNYLPAMSYLLITSLFAEWFSFSAALIVTTFGIWIWGKLCALYNHPNPKATIYNICLATALASFIYFPFIFIIILVIIGIATAKPFRLQEWLIALLGLTTPIYLFVAFLFINGNIGQYKIPTLSFYWPLLLNSKWVVIAFMLLIISIAIGLYYILNNMRRQVVLTRRSWKLIFLYSLLAFVSVFVNQSNNFSNIIFVALPLSAIFAAAFFYPQKKIVPIILHWSIVVVYIAVAMNK